MNKIDPFVINFPFNGNDDIGFLAFGESNSFVPFEIKRVFWTFQTPENVLRGRHAHYQTEMVLIAVAGRIIVTTEVLGKEPEIFVLSKPYQGIFIPKLCWHTMQYSEDAIQLVLASTAYVESDYIRDYKNFKNGV